MYFGSYFGKPKAATTVVVPIESATPVTSPYTPDEPEYVDHTAVAVSRLPEQFKAKTS